ncbi:MAG: ParB/RepB/Spo0J family partition protein [Erysipelotrichaceae bacterium]|nr:ParB/RepB/Spo0J family partition protein [Erysipelotrichaceae bacterium]
MANNQKLGKGLGAIFGNDIDAVLDEISRGESEYKGDSAKIKVADIRPNPYQPRKKFDETGLSELADSIKEHGVFNPILVRKSISGYELIAGERRLRASKLAKLEEIPAIIVDFDDRDMMEVSLLENIQREDLSPLDEAKAYEQLIKKLNYTQEELGKRVSKSRTYITNTMRLLKLPAKIQDLLNSGKLSYGHARALLAIDDEETMEKLANRCIKENLTVRDIERLAREDKPKAASRPKATTDPYLNSVRRKLEDKFATQVEVDNKKIAIHYGNTKELNRILEILDCLDK